MLLLHSNLVLILLLNFCLCRFIGQIKTGVRWFALGFVFPQPEQVNQAATVETWYEAEHERK